MRNASRIESIKPNKKAEKEKKNIPVDLSEYKYRRSMIDESINY
jgi:hypothetical protein